MKIIYDEINITIIHVFNILTIAQQGIVQWCQVSNGDEIPLLY